MINALLKLDNSEPMQRHVDDASSALYPTIQRKNHAKLFYTHPTHCYRQVKQPKKIAKNPPNGGFLLVIKEGSETKDGKGSPS